MKRYNWEIIIYNLDDLDRVEGFCNLFKVNYAYILHDKDLDADNKIKKLHIHFLIFFPYQKTDTAVSKQLDIPISNIRKIDNKVGAIRYLIHLDHKDKYQYNFDNIISNFDISIYFNTKTDKSNKEGINVLQLIDYINQKDYTTLEDLIYYAIQNGLYSDLRRNQNIIIKLLYTKNYN